MAPWFCYFLFYSFAGYLLEKLHARLTRSPNQVRKCFLLLPLCPVYGLAMTALLALAPADMGLFSLTVLGAAVCTAAEYAVHLFYETALGVRFWDYRALRGNLRGRICPQYALVWGPLSAGTVRWIHPAAASLAARVPPWAAFALWILLAADAVLSAALLRRYRDPEGLTLGAVRQIWASSQSSTSL